MKRHIRVGVSTLALSALTATLPAFAQETVPETQDDERQLNQVVVTGSFIRRQSQADLASPLDTVSNVDIGNIGAQNIGDLVQTLTINTGAQNNPDAFTQGGTTGTSNINLRGLGVASTLVLLNGRRQTLSSAPTNDGINFVDTSSLVPLIAVQRVEILKDGASSLYGSDAVAGVANFITREDYEGILFSGEYTNHLSQGDYDEFNIQGLVGHRFGDLSVMAAASYLDRSPLTTEERRLSRPQDDTSALGNPGAFFMVPGAGAAPTPDPDCVAGGGIPLGAFCGFDFGEFFNLVPDEKRLTIFSSAKYDITPDITARIEGGYADNRAIRGNSPTFPFLQLGNAVVPDFNPDNPFGANVVFFGRAIGNGGSVSPASFDSETWRVSGSLEGDFETSFISNARWNLNATYADNDFQGMTEDTVTDRFACALRGFNASPAFNAATGLDCTAANPFLTANGAAIPADGTFYNPFGSSLIGTGTPNDPALQDYIVEFGVSDRRAELFVGEAFVSGDVFELPAGPIGVALGAQYRKQDISASFDEITENDGFAFLIGEQPFSGSQDVYAVFGEVAIPVSEFVDLQLALRYEDYGAEGGSTVDPKVAVIVRPNEDVSLRASYSTSFRAPSTFQLQGQSTTLQQVSDPNNGGANAFVAVRALGNPNLEPESSQAFNVGATYEPLDGLQFNVDYFNFDFTDAIVQTAPQTVVNADPDGPDIIRSPAGTIIQVNNSYVNAATVETSGLDFSVRYTLDTGFGTFTPSFVGTYIFEYDLQATAAGAPIAGAGNRNFTNFGSPTPQLRFNLGMEYTNGAHSLNMFGRYIDNYNDDQNNLPVDEDFRLDVQYGLALNEFINREKAAQFTVGVRNAFGARPPSVNTNGGFDSRVHDPRGALITVGFDVEF